MAYSKGSERIAHILFRVGSAIAPSLVSSMDLAAPTIGMDSNADGGSAA